MKNLILIGAGDMGLEIWSWIKDSKGYGIEFIFKGFLDSNPNALDKYTYCDAKVLGNENDYSIVSNDVFACTIAKTSVKEAVTNSIQQKGGTFINVIHNSVLLFKNVNFGVGIIVSPNCVISNNCTLGNHILINLATTLGHDVEVGSYCQINSHCDITGHVKIHDKVFLGTSSCIIPGIEIEEGATIGAGSVVIKNVKQQTTVFGNPARQIKIA